MKRQNSSSENWNSILTNERHFHRGNKILLWGMFLLSFSGFCFFYLIPFAVSFFYSVMDNPIRKNYCGLKNYMELFQNPYFMRGLKNTAVFMLWGIPLNMLLSFAVALVIRRKKKHFAVFSLAFLIPLAVPSATSALFWKSLLGQRGAWNRMLGMFHIRGADWLDCKYSMLFMVLIFVWKNIGYNMALFLSGLSNIPDEYYQYAEVEGAGILWKFRNITCVYVAPTTFIVLIMSFVNSFKVFKEIYLITGEYPPDSLYVLQHFMNNMFLSLDYPKLASAVYILTLLVVLFVAGAFQAEKKISKNLHA